MALPGGYIVRLTVDGRHHEAPLTLKQDPRVRPAGRGLEAQLTLATGLAELLTESSRAVLAAESEQAQLKALTPTGATAATVRDFAARLSDLLGTEGTTRLPPQPRPAVCCLRCRSHRRALYRGHARRRCAHGRAAQRRGGGRTGLAVLLADWRGLAADLGALNRQLKAAKLAMVRPDLAPPRDVNLADED